MQRLNGCPTTFIGITLNAVVPVTHNATICTIRSQRAATGRFSRGQRASTKKQVHPGEGFHDLPTGAGCGRRWYADLHSFCHKRICLATQYPGVVKWFSSKSIPVSWCRWFWWLCNPHSDNDDPEGPANGHVF